MFYRHTDVAAMRFVAYNSCAGWTGCQAIQPALAGAPLGRNDLLCFSPPAAAIVLVLGSYFLHCVQIRPVASPFSLPMLALVLLRMGHFAAAHHSTVYQWCG